MAGDERKEAIARDIASSFSDRAVGDEADPCPPGAGILSIKKVTFHGNEIVERDTEGPFPKPEWDIDRSADRQSPVCYVRGSSIVITAELEILANLTGPVEIRGSADIDGQSFTWSTAVAVRAGEKAVIAREIPSLGKLRETIFYHPRVEIAWRAGATGHALCSAGSSAHEIYVILGAPRTIVHWTLIDISCRAALGAEGEHTLRASLHRAFATRLLTRKRDGKGLSYWKSGDSVASLKKAPATGTWALLASRNGRGQCGAWVELFLDMTRVHGVTSGRKFEVLPNRALGTGDVPAPEGILVKRWRFVTPPATSPVGYTHVLHASCLDEPGNPGQRNADPPSAFYNHYVVRVDQEIFDPSYGVGPFATTRDWQSAAVDGLASAAWDPPRAGFVGSASDLVILREAPASPAMDAPPEED